MKLYCRKSCNLCVDSGSTDTIDEDFDENNGKFHFHKNCLNNIGSCRMEKDMYNSNDVMNYYTISEFRYKSTRLTSIESKFPVLLAIRIFTSRFRFTRNILPYASINT